MDDGSELFDVVDEKDQVIGQATRREVHQKRLRHRSVHILVFNSHGDLFLQKRAASKDENPGFWDTSAAGHLNSGENYRECAEREMHEELGIRASLEFLFKIDSCPETFWEHIEVFRCVTDSPITLNPFEIDDGQFFSLQRIQDIIKDHSLPLTSSFQWIIKKYLNLND